MMDLYVVHLYPECRICSSDYPPQPVSVLRLAPTPSSSFLLAQAIFEPNLFPYKYPTILKFSHSSYLPAYNNGTECSETLAYKIQMPGNYPEENIQHHNIITTH